MSSLVVPSKLARINKEVRLSNAVADARNRTLGRELSVSLLNHWYRWACGKQNIALTFLIFPPQSLGHSNARHSSADAIDVTRNGNPQSSSSEDSEPPSYKVSVPSDAAENIVAVV